MSIIRYSVVASIIAIASVSCEAQTHSSSEVVASEMNGGFAVNIYEICNPSSSVSVSHRIIDHAFESEKVCINTDQHVIGIQPKIVRISSNGDESWQLFMKCEVPEPDGWRKIIENPSEIALVANEKVLADFRTTGSAWFPHCGIFSTKDLASATAICQEVLSAWGKDPVACTKNCKRPEDFSEGTCIEPEQP